MLEGDVDQDQNHVADCDDPPDTECLDKPIDADEIIRAVKHLKANKPPGLDGILAEMITYSLEQTLSFLTKLFNHIFDTGQYPNAWSGGIIVPIHKSGDTDNPDDYCGVSLLTIFGKSICTYHKQAVNAMGRG